MAAEPLSDSVASYLRLAAIWPPHVPRDDADYDVAADLSRDLSFRDETGGAALDEGEEMYLEAVIRLLVAYDEENDNYDFSADRVASLGERLEEMMNDYGVDLPRLAKVAGIGRDEMDEVMAGRATLSGEAVKRLAAEYGCDEDFLL